MFVINKTHHRTPNISHSTVFSETGSNDTPERKEEHIIIDLRITTLYTPMHTSTP